MNQLRATGKNAPFSIRVDFEPQKLDPETTNRMGASHLRWKRQRPEIFLAHEERRINRRRLK
jgi:hypothetical protein